MKRRAQIAAPIHSIILGLSTYLVGLYFGHALTAGVEMIALQVGLIGMLAYVGFTNRYNQTIVIEEIQEEVPPTVVETRLERHVANGQIRIDNGELDSRPVSSKQTKKQNSAYRYGIH